MKVLKNNFTVEETYIEENIKPYPRPHTCDDCGSELEYDESDLHMGFLGCMYLTCPLCNYENMIEDNENNITLTKDNVEFPVHFWHTSKETGAIDSCNNKEVKDAIHEAIDFLRNNKDEYYWFTAHGNLFVIVFKHSGDESYDVLVTNDYYETSIPFENVDYSE